MTKITGQKWQLFVFNHNENSLKKICHCTQFLFYSKIIPLDSNFEKEPKYAITLDLYGRIIFLVLSYQNFYSNLLLLNLLYILYSDILLPRKILLIILEKCHL